MSRNGRGTDFSGLHVLVDDDPRWARDPVEQARAALDGGAHVIQLRAKHATDRELLAWAEVLRRMTLSAHRSFVINDRFDLALAAGADGVHLGQGDLPPTKIPKDLREKLQIGRSTHDFEQIQQARADGVDYIAFGPIFPTASKESAYDAQGLERLAEAVRRGAPLPLVAIGGIDAARLSEVLETGVAGVAVIGAIAGARNATAATEELAGHFGDSQ